jgi:hypothetical protein
MLRFAENVRSVVEALRCVMAIDWRVGREARENCNIKKQQKWPFQCRILQKPELLIDPRILTDLSDRIWSFASLRGVGPGNVCAFNVLACDWRVVLNTPINKGVLARVFSTIPGR